MQIDCASPEGTLTLHEITITVVRSSQPTTVQFFCNEAGEAVYFPDRTLVVLLQVNGSTLRGRFNRLTKKQAGLRLLLTDRNTEMGKLKGANFMHGMVALNHLELVNSAIREWIAPNQHRLGTRMEEMEENLNRAGVCYSMSEGCLQLVRHRPMHLRRNSDPIMMPRGNYSMFSNGSSSHSEFSGSYSLCELSGSQDESSYMDVDVQQTSERWGDLVSYGDSQYYFLSPHDFNHSPPQSGFFLNEHSLNEWLRS